MKQIALILAVAAMLSGCSDAVTPTPSKPGYIDSNPSMVFSTLKSGDIPYEGYRLLIDVNELSDREMARKDLALGKLLTKDLTKLGVAIDETAFRIEAASDVMKNYFSDDNLELIEQLREAAGLTQEEMVSAMIEVYRPQYLMSLMLDYQREKIKSELVVDSGDPNEIAAQKAAEVLQAYYDEADIRCDYADSTLLVTLDGEGVPLTDAHTRFIRYVATIYRMDLLARLQAGVAMLRDLEAKGKPVDMEMFSSQANMQIDAFLADTKHMAEIDRHLETIGATREEYFDSYRKLLLGEYAGQLFSAMLEEEFNALPADAPDRPENLEAYYYKRANDILEGAKLVNINGRG